MEYSLKQFSQLHKKLQLSHHPFNRSYNYLKWAFKGIDFSDKTVLDIGGGNGIYSYYAKYKGAKFCINLEPFEAGSKNIQILNNKDDLGLSIEINNQTFQDFNYKKKFDIIILHDSINHLDEEVFCNIHNDNKSYESYCKLINKMYGMLASEGTIIVTDCSRYNFWGILGLKSPFAPSIDWHLHQSPNLIIKMFKAEGMRNFKLRWSPFKRFGILGRLLSYFGFLPSFFMQSHFNLIIEK